MRNGWSVPWTSTPRLARGKAQFSPGVLAQADGGVLYVDEVNLLPDTLVDLLLDVAASGTNRVERDGISHRHSARFVLIGTMNPEEGELRPQLLDRFGLMWPWKVCPNLRPGSRSSVGAWPSTMTRRLSARNGRKHRRSCASAARRRASAGIALDDQALAWITERCFAAGVDGLRADLVWLRAARPLCLARWCSH